MKCALLSLCLLAACAPSAVRPIEAPRSPVTASARPWAEDRLPRSTATGPLPPAGVTLIVSPAEIHFGDGQAIMTLPIDEHEREQGPGADPSGRGFVLAPLAEALAQRRLQTGARSAGVEEQESIVAFDASTPYLLVVKVLFTLHQGLAARRFHFPVKHADQIRFITVTPPSVGEAGAAPFGFPPVVKIAAAGLSVIIDGKSLGAHCAPGPGITFPITPAGVDVGGLRQCLTALKASAPSSPETTRIILLPGPDIDFQMVVAVMDAARATDAGALLFPDAILGIAK